MTDFWTGVFVGAGLMAPVLVWLLHRMATEPGEDFKSRDDIGIE